MNPQNKSTKNDTNNHPHYSFQAYRAQMKENRIDLFGPNALDLYVDEKYNNDDNKLSIPENTNNEGVIDTFDLQKKLQLFKIAKERDEQDAKKEFVPKTEVNYSTPYGTDPVDQRLAEQRVIAANNNNTYDYESYVIYYYYLSLHIYMIWWY